MDVGSNTVEVLYNTHTIIRHSIIKRSPSKLKLSIQSNYGYKVNIIRIISGTTVVRYLVSELYVSSLHHQEHDHFESCHPNSAK